MKLLDRLMARQARLLANLDAPPPELAHRRKPPAPTHDPAAEAAACAVAHAQLKAGELAAARATLEPYALSGRDVGTFTTLARICTDQGDVEQALAALQRAEALDPADRNVWRLLAKLLSTQRRYREELVYRRRLGLVDANAPAQVYIDWIKALLRSLDKGKRAAASEVELIVARFEAAPDVTDGLRLQFTGPYYLLGASSAKAMRLYNAGRPCAPDQRDVPASVVSLTTWCTQHQLPMPRLNDEGAPGRRPTLHQLDDVLVFPGLGWIPVLDDGAMLASGFPMPSRVFHIESPHSPLLMYRGHRAELRVPRTLREENGPALLLGGSQSWYETLMQYAAGLAIAESVGCDRALPLVINEETSPALVELLGLLGYGDNDLLRITADAPTRFRRLHVPSRLTLGAEWVDPLLSRWYRSRLAAPVAGKRQRKLYVKAAGARGVTIDNEPVVAEILSAAGYETFESATATVGEQIEAFANASHVIGGTSEGLTNLLFAATGATVVELRAVNWLAMGGAMHFDRVAAACGQRYTAVDCPLASSNLAETTPVHVDPSRLRELLETQA
jgi:tetratricopeptide (TPR) repeat protein